MTWFDLTTGYLIGTAIWSASLFVALIVLLKMRRGSDEIPIRKKLVNAAISLWLLCVLMTLLEVGFAVGYDRTDSFNMSNVSKKWFRKYAEPEEKVLRFGPNEGIVYRDVKPFPESIPESLPKLSPSIVAQIIQRVIQLWPTFAAVNYGQD